MRTEERKLERREQNRMTAGMGINHFLTNKHCLPTPTGGYTGRSRGTHIRKSTSPRGGAFRIRPPCCPSPGLDASGSAQRLTCSQVTPAPTPMAHSNAELGGAKRSRRRREQDSIRLLFINDGQQENACKREVLTPREGYAQALSTILATLTCLQHSQHKKRIGT